MERFALSTILRIASEAVITPIIRPIFYGLNGVTSAAGSAGLSGMSDASGNFSLLGAAKGVSGLYDAITGVGAGGGYITGFNNYAAGAFPGVFSGGSANFAAPGTLGLSSADSLYAAMPAGPTQPFFGTASGTALGVAGLAASGYGLYNAFQTGGAKGWAQGAASVAGGVGSLGMLASAGGTAGSLLGGAGGALAAAGPWGLAAAAVLTIASMFLSGQKPSDKTGTYALNLITGEGEYGGLGGDRYTQENRDAAKSLADQLKTISDSLVTSLGTDKPGKIFQTTYGDRDGIKLLLDGVTRTYDRSETGSQQLIKDFTSSIIEALRYGSGVTSNEMRIVDLAGGNLDTILGNLDWLHNVYEPMGKTVEQTNTLQVALDNLAATYDPVIKKAQELGLSTEDLTAQLARGSDALKKQVSDSFWQASREAQGRSYLNSIEGLRTSWMQNREAFATAGEDADALFQDQLRSVLRGLTGEQLLDVANSFRVVDDAATNIAEELILLGLSTDALAASQDAAQKAAQQAAAAAAEAEAAAREEAARRESATSSASGVVVSLADYARGLSYGSESPLSLRSQYSQAQREFQMAADRALAGDASSLSGLQDYAETFRSTARSLYGSTTGYSQALNEIQGVLSRVGTASAEALTQTFMAAEMQTQTETLVAALARLQAEVAALRREQQQATMRPQAA